MVSPTRSDKNRTRKIIAAVLAVLLVTNICVTFALFIKIDNMSKAESSIEYVMYIGLNDKDEYKQLISDEEAKSIIEEICFRYVDGFTIQKATGTWVDEKDVATYENTYVCYLYDTDEETVYSIADEAIKQLNQNSILIKKNFVSTEYYTGK